MRSSKSPHQRVWCGDKKGVNLVEAVITIVLLAIMLTGISTFIITAMRAWVIISGRESMVGISRGAMNRVTAEIRRIKKPNNITTPLSSSQLQFLDISNVTVTFSQEGTNLRRNSDILATGLVTPTGLIFSYRDSTGEVIADVNAKQAVRSIRVWLSFSSGSQRTTLESSARIRNL